MEDLPRPDNDSPTKQANSSGSGEEIPPGSSRAEEGGGETRDNPALLPEILANLDPQTQSGQIISAFFSGPIPLPSILKGYEEIVPGSAQEIITNAMEQSQHRRRLESIRVQGDEWRSDKGLVIGATLASVCLIGGIALGLYNHEWLAGILVTTTIGSIFGTFVYSHHQRQAEIDKKVKLKKDILAEQPPHPKSPSPPTKPSNTT